MAALVRNQYAVTIRAFWISWITWWSIWLNVLFGDAAWLPGITLIFGMRWDNDLIATAVTAPDVIADVVRIPWPSRNVALVNRVYRPDWWIRDLDSVRAILIILSALGEPRRQIGSAAAWAVLVGLAVLWSCDDASWGAEP